MSEQNPETPAPEAPAEEPQPVAAEQEQKPPPWGDDFDPAKAWERIQKQAKDIDRMRSQGVLTDDQRTKLDEYHRLEEASQSELERAQKTAQTASDRVTSLQGRLAAAEIKAALIGVVPDVDGFIEDINVAKFINEDGEVNTEAITALREKYAAFAPSPEKPGMKPNPAQGASASPAPTVQDQIARAQEAGDFQTVIRLKSRLALEASDN